MYYLTVSVGQAFAHSLTGCLWSKVSQKTEIKMLIECVVPSEASSRGASVFQLIQVAAVRIKFLRCCITWIVPTGTETSVNQNGFSLLPGKDEVLR